MSLTPIRMTLKINIEGQHSIEVGLRRLPQAILQRYEIWKEMFELQGLKDCAKSEDSTKLFMATGEAIVLPNLINTSRVSIPT